MTHFTVTVHNVGRYSQQATSDGIFGCGSAEGPPKNSITTILYENSRSFDIDRPKLRGTRRRNQNQFSFRARKVTTAFMPIYLCCHGRRPSESEARLSATRHNQRRNAHHHKRAMASPRYSTRARVRDCAPTNNTHPTTQRRRRRRRRRARHRRFPSPRERRRDTRAQSELGTVFLVTFVAPLADSRSSPPSFSGACSVPGSQAHRRHCSRGLQIWNLSSEFSQRVRKVAWRRTRLRSCRLGESPPSPASSRPTILE